MRVGQFNFEMNLLQRMTIEIKRRITNETLSIFIFNIFMVKNIIFLFFRVLIHYTETEYTCLMSSKIVLWYEKRKKTNKKKRYMKLHFHVYISI